MSRRAITITAAIVAALAVGGIGYGVGDALSGGDSGASGTVATASQDPTITPTTTHPPIEPPATTATPPASEPTEQATKTANPVLPTPATGSLTQGRKKVLLDGKLTIPNTPTVWEEDSSDADSAEFKDVSVCSGKNCPKILFFDTSKGQNHVNYGDNPMAAWAADLCHGQGTDSSADFTAGGEPAKYRHLSCEGQDFFAWYVPGKKVLVTTHDVDGQTSNPQIIQAALQGVVWSR